MPMPAAAQDFPELTGRVVDAANIIPDDIEAGLTQQLEALETQSQRQLVVTTLPSLQGYDISDYGYQLGREWGIGDEERNDGALLIVAPNERKVRIEVGYGLEPILTDGLSSIIVNQVIVPRFKEGDMPRGIVDGADAIIEQLTLPEEEALRVAQEAAERASSGSGARNAVGGAIFLVMFLLFFVFPIVAAARGGRRRRRSGMGGVVGDIILWEVMKAATRGSSRGSGWGGGGGGWSGGGGGFSGGGFSGGGGSFGGGGASGGW